MSPDNVRDPDTNLSELCREFGISRETGYVWLRRYRAANHDLREVEDVIVAARKYRPTWGPRKLRVYLVDRNPAASFPSESAFAAISDNGPPFASTRRRRAHGAVGLVVPPRHSP